MSKDYTIKPCGDQFCLYTADGSKLLGRHSTEAQAQAQETMLANARAGGSAYSIPGVEIFKVGEHNGDTYDSKDLQDMVAAANELDFLPAIKLGHAKDSGAPAYGYVDNLRLDGESVVGDFTDLPQEVYQAILDKRYGRVSAEVFWNMRRMGKKFRRALGAVALLGQEIPGVAKLKPLYQTFDLEGERALAYEADISFTENKNNISLDDLVSAVQSLQAKVAEFAKGNPLSDTTGSQDHGSKQPDEENSTMADAKADEQIQALQNTVAELFSKVSEGDTKLKDYQQENQRLRAYQREQTIREKVAKVTLPAFQPIITALYEAALDNDSTVKLYSADGKSEDISPTAAVDKLVEHLNNTTIQKLFTEQSHHSEKKTGEYEDAGAEADRLAKEAVAKKEYANYGDAFEGVLNKDADLKAAYIAQRAN